MYDIVFVVLVYRNTNDLKDFFLSNHIEKSKTVVVNSYYDDASEECIKSIAHNNYADFISVPNRGYGAGNNAGVNYVLKNYDFKYLVISNADVMIEKLEIDSLEKYGAAIIAPNIINLNGKKQNPSVPFTPFIWYENLRLLIYKERHFRLLNLIFAYSRLTKTVYYIISKWRRKIFSAHGAFVIIPKCVVESLIPLYNEEMFLFNEEEHLGRKSAEKGISTIYAPEIIIRHKEDGSMKVASINEFEMLRQSYLVYYNFWFNKK